MTKLVDMRRSSTSTAACPSRRLADVAKVIFVGLASSRRAAAADEHHSVPLINVRDLSEGRVPPIERLEARPVPKGYSADRYQVHAGDVVITCRGSQLKVACIAEEAHGAVLSSNLIGIRTGPDLLAPVLFAFLQSPRGQAALLGRSRSSTLGLALSPKSVGRLEVPVPPLEVQQQIAELVRAAEDHYVAAIEAAERRRMLGREVANTLLRGALVSELPERS